jgi:hypothetical protein
MTSPYLNRPPVPAPDGAYRGYLVKRNPFDGMFYVSKDGHHICACTSYDAAKHAIDEVTQ